MTTMVHLFGAAATTAERSKELLGGKGSNLAEMASIGLPVPPGFTITTEVCTAYYDNGEQFPAGLVEEVTSGIAHIEGITGKRFGDPANPLLVSVRSGARVSMPGMMDTVRSEEHTSELQSLMRSSYAVFCSQKNTTQLHFHQLHLT